MQSLDKQVIICTAGYTGKNKRPNGYQWPEGYVGRTAGQVSTMDYHNT